MAIVVFCALLVNVLPYYSVVAVFEPDTGDVETTHALQYGLCEAIHRNSPCAEVYNVTTKPNTTTTYDELVSRWSDRLRTELIMLSMESNTLFCKETSPEVEFEHRVIAKAVVDMLTSLHTMQRTDEILSIISLTVVLKDLRDECCERNITGGNIFHRWLVMVNDTLKYESSLREEYAAKRVQAALNTAHQFRKHFSDKYYLIGTVEYYLCQFTVFREAYVNRVFMEEVFNNRSRCDDVADEDCKQFMLAEAIVILAREPDDRYQRTLVNHIYRSALLEVALGTTCDGSSLKNKKLDVKNRLFEILKRWLGEEMALNSTLSTVLRRLRVNEIIQGAPPAHQIAYGGIV